MMTIILENGKNERLKSVYEKNNGKYLFTITNNKIFPILSELADCDNEIVSSENMSNLINELEILKKGIKDYRDVNHINEIIELVKEAKDHDDYFLIFTPFER